jgi:hypothetical protein
MASLTFGADAQGHQGDNGILVHALTSKWTLDTLHV